MLKLPHVEEAIHKDWEQVPDKAFYGEIDTRVAYLSKLSRVSWDRHCPTDSRAPKQVWMTDALWQAVKAHADARVDYLAAQLDAMRLHNSDCGSAQHIEGDIGSQHLDLLHQQVKAARNRVKEISAKAFKQWNRAKADEITRHDDEKGNVATLWNQIRQITRAKTIPKKNR